MVYLLLPRLLLPQLLPLLPLLLLPLLLLLLLLLHGCYGWCTRVMEGHELEGRPCAWSRRGY